MLWGKGCEFYSHPTISVLCCDAVVQCVKYHLNSEIFIGKVLMHCTWMNLSKCVLESTAAVSLKQHWQTPEIKSGFEKSSLCPQHVSPTALTLSFPAPSQLFISPSPNKATAQGVISACGFFLLTGLHLSSSPLRCKYPPFFPVPCFLLAGGAASGPGFSGDVRGHVADKWRQFAATGMQ